MGRLIYTEQQNVAINDLLSDVEYEGGEAAMIGWNFPDDVREDEHRQRCITHLDACVAAALAAKAALMELEEEVEE